MGRATSSLAARPGAVHGRRSHGCRQNDVGGPRADGRCAGNRTPSTIVTGAGPAPPTGPPLLPSGDPTATPAVLLLADLLLVIAVLAAAILVTVLVTRPEDRAAI